MSEESTLTGRAPTDAEEERTKAETKRILVETSNAEKQGERNDAEARKLLAEARVADAQAEVAEYMAAREKRKELNELAKDSHHHRFVFTGRVDGDSVRSCVDQFTTWQRTSDDALKVEIIINSPGGSIVDGLALVDYLNGLRAEGHEINTHALGFAASMAGVILQAGDERIMSANSFLLIHEGSMGAQGDFGQVKDYVKLMEMMHERIIDLFVTRAKPVNPKTTRAFIKSRWSRTDWWLTSDEALKCGFVDTVR